MTPAALINELADSLQQLEDLYNAVRLDHDECLILRAALITWAEAELSGGVASLRTGRQAAPIKDEAAPITDRTSDDNLSENVLATGPFATRGVASRWPWPLPL